MVAQRLGPKSIVTQQNLTGTLADIQDDPDSPNATWMVATAKNVSTEVTVDFDTPNGPLTTGAGIQQFKALVRKFSSTQTGVPSARIVLLQGDTMLGLTDFVSITSAVGQIITMAWDASLVTDSTQVRMRVIGSTTGQGPSVQNTVDVGAVEWNAELASGVPAITLGDGVAIRDEVSVVQGDTPPPVAVRGLNEALNVADGVAGSLSGDRDPLPLADDVVAQLSGPSDPLYLSDEIEVHHSATGSHLRTVSDGMSLIDTSDDIAWDLEEIVSEAIAPGDAATGSTTSSGTAREVTDTLGTTDIATRVAVAARSSTDGMAIIDGVTRVAVAARSSTDGMAIIDGVTIDHVAGTLLERTISSVKATGVLV